MNDLANQMRFLTGGGDFVVKIARLYLARKDWLVIRLAQSWGTKKHRSSEKNQQVHKSRSTYEGW